MSPNSSQRSRRLNTPAGRAIAAILIGVLLFGLTGWAAGKRSFLLIDWGAFQQGDALVFLGAYAQLVLAAAVFFQIRTADRALVRQAEAHEHELRSERANSLVTLVATAANARSLYVHAIPALRNVTHNHGQQDALDRAEAELVAAEQRRQDAHAARAGVTTSRATSSPAYMRGFPRAKTS
jgi:cellobiose-specific phosphotransferase system component IIA